MCGIALLFQAGGSSVVSGAIERMTRALTHRGPDAHATLVRGDAALGHTRLSIVDIAGGAQPMVSDDGRYAIVFNGEIYNYQELRKALEASGARFRTRSDTEVILQLYRRDGAKCVDALRGMFAFAIHDQQERRVFLARDRVGIKPFFYHWDGRTLIAASEMKALFASGLVRASLAPRSIRSYFTYQFAVTPHTPFSDVLELPPGHTLTLESGGSPRLHAYWDISFPREGEYETLDEVYWTTQFENALHDAVASHTIGEVPIGAYLSAGIDSSALTWLLAQHRADKPQTFSIHFTDNDLDESSMYRAIAKHLDVPNREVELSGNGSPGYVSTLADAMYHLEQPQRMALDVPYFLLSDLVQKANHKVVYTGDGADEILAGYDHYRQDYMRLWAGDIQDAQLRSLLYFTQYTRDFSEPYVKLLHSLHDRDHQRRVTDRFGCYPVWYDFWQITAEFMPGLFNPELEDDLAHDDALDELAATMKPHVEGRHRVNQSLYIETKTRLPGWILWRSDRMSMAHGVEARVPFLDHPLIELAARIPPDLKLNGMNEKYLLKKISLPHLPKHPWDYKKKAFYTPIREWFFTPDQQEQLERYLSADALSACGLFNPTRVNELRGRLAATAAPTNMNDYYRAMQLEWVMMLVLTTQILHDQFVLRNSHCYKPDNTELGSAA